jgi:hypothetical protein
VVWVPDVSGALGVVPLDVIAADATTGEIEPTTSTRCPTCFASMTASPPANVNDRSLTGAPAGVRAIAPAIVPVSLVDGAVPGTAVFAPSTSRARVNTNGVESFRGCSGVGAAPSGV